MAFVTTFQGRLILDPRAAETRAMISKQQVKDLASSTMRWGLHLSTEEAEALEQLNPDTLGHTDARIRSNYWQKFMTSPESKPYRVQNV